MKPSSFLGTALAALLFSGCIASFSGYPRISGSGVVRSEIRNVSQFDRVSVSGSGELVLEQGDEESLTIEAEDNLLPYLRSEVINGHLKVGPHDVNLHPTKTIRYLLKLKKLQELHLSGAVNAQTGQLKTGDLNVSVSGAGKVRTDRLEADKLSIHISGSGDFRMSGKVNSQDIHISGSGDCQAADLQSAKAEVSISGSGSATLWVQEVLDVQVSGSGTIRYYGNPLVSQHVSGSGSVRSLGNK